MSPHNRDAARTPLHDDEPTPPPLPPFDPRPPSDSISIRASSSGLAKLLATLLGVVAAGGTGWAGHHLAAGQTDDRVAALEKRVADYESRTDLQLAALSASD